MTAARLPQPDPRHLGRSISSFDLHLRAEGKKDKTRDIYLDATRRFAGWLVSGRPDAVQMRSRLVGGTVDVDDSGAAVRWKSVTKVDVQGYLVFLMEWGYSPNYVNNQYRALQQFSKWFAEEEESVDWFRSLKPPPPGDDLPPVLSAEQMTLLIKKTEADRTFRGRRDAAIIRLFACTGARLSELALMRTENVGLENREAFVVGKGGKQRKLRFDNKTTRAIDRYLAIHSDRLDASLPALWLGLRLHMSMTPSGVRQAVERRADEVGLDVNPHMFRHTFSHNWLDKGGTEGDLMELNGWDSAQMLQRYGRSARSARARRAYDRINVMDGI